MPQADELTALLRGGLWRRLGGQHFDSLTGGWPPLAHICRYERPYHWV